MVDLEAIRNKRRAAVDLPPPEVRRSIRLSAGLAQQDIADAFQPPIHRETVSRWERGERNPRGQNLLAYVAVLNELRNGAA